MSRATPEASVSSEYAPERRSGNDVGGEPNVLVLMATYNGVPWLETQLASILAQEGVDLQLVVSDDASTDATLQTLSACAAQQPRVTLLPPTTRGGSACANFLRLMRDCDASDCDYVALADQDDVWHPRKLAQAHARLRSTHAALYSGAVLANRPDTRTRILNQNTHQREFDFLFEGAGQGCTFVLTSAFFRKVQAFVKDHPDLLAGLHYHDWLIYALARAWRDGWTYDQKPTMLYRQHGTNDTGARGSLASVLKRLRLIRSGWYREQVGRIFAACSVAAPEDARWRSFQRTCAWRSTAGTHFMWAAWLLLFSRRRLKDRCVLFASALWRWI